MIKIVESEKELNSKILKITMTILEKYPELYENLGEMPVTIPNIENPEINIKNLREYYESLIALLYNYVLEHNTKRK